MFDLSAMTRRFLLGEGKAPSLKSYIQSVGEILGSIKPATKADTNRLSVAKQHVKEIKRMVSRLESKIDDLEEQLKEK